MLKDGRWRPADDAEGVGGEELGAVALVLIVVAALPGTWSRPVILALASAISGSAAQRAAVATVRRVPRYMTDARRGPGHQPCS